MENPLIQINATPATIDADFDSAEQQLREYLKRYDTIIDPDEIKDAKKQRTELRKQISELDKRIKDVLKDASEPIRQADERRKKLIQLGKDVDDKLKEQIDQCEKKTRDKAEELLTALREKLFKTHGVEDEFRRAEFDDLILISSVTAQGDKLTKKAKDTLDARVRDDKALQDRTHMRLSKLKNRCYEAGLKAPLERGHVEHFLFADDERYEAEIQRMLDTEIERQSQAEVRMRQEWEREQEQKERAEREEAERKARLQAQETTDSGDSQDEVAPPEGAPSPEPPEPETAPEPPAEGKVYGDKVVWHVVCTFRIEVPANITADTIKAGAEKKLADAGITTLQNVTCQKEQRHDQAA